MTMTREDIVRKLEQFENVKIVKHTGGTDIKVITCVDKNRKEFLIFPNTQEANKYAVATIIKYEDDPKIISMLKKRNMSIKTYAENIVKTYNAEYVLSYNQKHKCALSKSIVAYRTI